MVDATNQPERRRAPRPDATVAYRVVFVCGMEAPKIPNVTVFDITPAEPTAQAALDALANCGVEPSDVRVRSLFMASGSLSGALLAYAALTGFSRRLIDVQMGEDPFPLAPLAAFGETVAAQVDPRELPQAQIGALHPELPSFVPAGPLTDDQIEVLKSASQLRFVPRDTRDVVDAVTFQQLAVIAGVRARKSRIHLPWLSTGAEPKDMEEPGVDLDALRKAASEIRSNLRLDVRDAVVDRVAVHPRYEVYSQAALVPAGSVVEALGSVMNPDTGLWRCTRPRNHRNGDANPSMVVTEEGLVQCPVCDPQPVDVLRLTLESTRMTVDQAAEWLLGLPAQ